MPFANNQGVKIYYEIEGEGYPLVLHAGLSGDGQLWKEAGYVAGLPGFKCILMDHRGHGMSDKPDGVEAHRMERYVEDVVALLDDVGVEKAAFWGFSDGGRVGFAVAQGYPERISKLVSLGEPGAWSMENKEGRIALAKELREDGVKQRVEQIKEEIAIPDWLEKRFLDSDAEMLALELEAWCEWEGIWKDMELVETATLFLAGDIEDPDVLVKEAEKRMPNGRGITLPGLGHLETFLAVEQALEQAKPFLEDLLEG